MVATVEVITFARSRDAMRLLRRPADSFAATPSFTRALLSGRGRHIYAPWPRHDDPRLRATGGRQDGWGLPDPRRVVLLASWDGEPQRARVADSSLVERWRGVYEPVHSHGALDGQDPFAAAEGRGWKGRVGSVLTYGRARGHLFDFVRQNNRVVEELRSMPSLLTSFNLLDAGRAGIGLSTFSCWSDLDAAVGFAYRRSPQHREAMRRSREGHYGGGLYFARLALTSSEGTVCGRDPFQLGSGEVGGHAVPARVLGSVEVAVGLAE
jgi:hypothetical protein